MKLGEKLSQLRDVAKFPILGTVNVRWGQLLREDPELALQLETHKQAGSVVTLDSLATIKSGVVTRANAFFILKELSFEQIPKRFHLTRRDFSTNAVLLDGVDTPFRIERRWLKPILRGPEDLVNAMEVAETEFRVFDVTASKDDLRKQTATGAIAYIKRGETFAYRTSDDDLKGGIPAQRAQVKNRKPFWYSLHVPKVTAPRIVVPEHYNKRYIATLLHQGNDSVVNDTLYTLHISDQAISAVLHASLNSILSWYQLELRGRTQHGEGVLKVKIPDFEGLLVLNPTKANAKKREKLAKLFAEVAHVGSMDSLAAVSEPARVVFDEWYLELCGFSNPSEARISIERELRAAISERHNRKESVAGAKLDRRKLRTSASADAYATRIAASLATFPDPRTWARTGRTLTTVNIDAKPDGPIQVGADLFNQNDVFSGSAVIATAPDNLSAHYVRLVLLHDPEITEVPVPATAQLQSIMKSFEEEALKWHDEFKAASGLALQSVTDDRLRASIIDRALTLLHAK